jgi:hypothetical protein
VEREPDQLLGISERNSFFPKEEKEKCNNLWCECVCVKEGYDSSTLQAQVYGFTAERLQSPPPASLLCTVANKEVEQLFSGGVTL